MATLHRGRVPIGAPNEGGRPPAALPMRRASTADGLSRRKLAPDGVQGPVAAVSAA
jgi:hypothetical protein